MNLRKNRFLDNVNPMRTLEKALTSGVTASVQHNSLYRPNVPAQLKAKAKSEWVTFLGKLRDKYSLPQSVDVYEKDIQSLKDLMNTKFPDAFNEAIHPRFNTDPGFRISHAQKSISVFLKHLWCMDMIATPPQCPIDRVVLGLAGARYPQTKWGYVNSIEEHRVKIEILQARAKKSESLAVWELENFIL